MQILKLTEQLESLIAKHDELQTNSILAMKENYGVIKSSELKSFLEDLKDAKRSLKIGIVGRVKAGKSSLLNALVFNGVDVLPKAATPMTAALTMIEYSDSLSAEVEFYKQSDILEIQAQHSQYLKELNRLKDEKFNEFKARLEKKQEGKLDQKDIDELDIKADKSAKRELNDNLILSSSYDQYERIKASDLKLSDECKTIEASNINELNKELLEYVGANGKYMPFTKSVTLKLNEESLKNIQIIDTPGVNDPIVSREARTKELLHKCDVVFIVSPAGQFLNAEDVGLLDRLGNKDGVNELFVIASKMDEQLYGSLKVETNGDLNLALDKLKVSFTKQLKDYTKEQERECSYAKELWQKLGKNDVIVSSGIAYSILKNEGKLDEMQEHVINLLRANYPEYFTDKEKTKENLNLLANIDLVKDKLEYVKSIKDDLLNKKSNEFINSATKNLDDFKNALIKNLNDELVSLKSLDLDRLKSQEKELSKAKDVASKELSKKYQEHLNQIDEKVKKLLVNTTKSYFIKGKDEVEDNVSEEARQESYTVWVKKRRTSTLRKIGSFFGVCDEYTYDEDLETRYRTVIHTNVMAGTIYNGLKGLTNQLEELINIKADENFHIWKQNLSRLVLQTLRENIDRDFIDEIIIAKAINEVVSSIKISEVSYSNTIPSSLNRNGKLTDDEGKRYVADVNEYLDNLEPNVIKDINNFISKIANELSKIDLSDEIFLSCQKELNKLALDIENKEQAIQTKENLIKEINQIGE